MEKTLVVTGASSGVGLEIARRFLAKDYRVVGIGRSADKLAAAKAELHSERFTPIAVDISVPEAVADCFRAVGETHNPIDVLVNNAAQFKMARLADFSLAEIASILDTNLKGTIFCTHQALPLLRKGARIINVASVSATHGIENQAVYCASKYGMNGFAEALGQELLERGIHVTTLCPGGIATPLWNEKNPYPGDLERLLTAGDIAELVEYTVGLPDRVVFKQAILFPSNEWH